jgi:hypothetical protein
MTNDERLAALAAQRDAEGKAFSGDESHRKAAMSALEKKLKSGDLAPEDLQRKLTKESAGGDLFYSGIAEASQEEWDRWRNSQPNKRRRVEQAKR